jgi:hypothetical protein
MGGRVGHPLAVLPQVGVLLAEQRQDEPGCGVELFEALQGVVRGMFIGHRQSGPSFVGEGG